ncbi:hypothetical protein FDT80_16290 [Sulfitobacter sabulilitoris]|uniref:Curlin n=2 Tax=Sulfitobacter sabulilitoris TaxID=2562655 RepID=A0A5S3PB25_9RHOB|nr:hypothetical protein FDT80_16290 [Sulfitobacter sabulilitoris]
MLPANLAMRVRQRQSLQTADNAITLRVTVHFTFNLRGKSMKLIKIALASTTALGLSMTAAHAQSNDAYLSQTGTGNNALVTQSGANNDAGSAAKTMKQITEGSGFGNDLDILQSGNGNEIGLNGLVQKSQNLFSNTADITQSSSGNSVGKVDQLTRNKRGNLSGNDLVILQTGGNNNAIGSVKQERNGALKGNIAAVTMDGAGNTIAVVRQVTQGDTSTAYVDENELTAVISGDNNGNGALSGYAAASSATTSELIQGKSTGIDSPVTQGQNTMNLLITGNSNQFGVTQYGSLNNVGLLSISGSNNQMGVYQDGTDNTVALADIAGIGNNVGLAQLGDRNFVLAMVQQNGNNVSSSQIGDDNETYIEVDGNGNDARVAVMGDNNYVDAEQRFGNSNDMAVDIFGSGNNMVGFSDNFSGDARTARNFGNGLTGQTFRRGSLWQHGSGNNLSLTVGAAGSDSNSNSFAMLQRGNGNTITGAITDGSMNQAAVAQNGNGNTTAFSQTGSNNVMGVIQ